MLHLYLRKRKIFELGQGEGGCTQEVWEPVLCGHMLQLLLITGYLVVLEEENNARGLAPRGRHNCWSAAGN